MNTNWEWSLSTEINRLLQTCQVIASGFYQSHNFPVLPWNPRQAYLPHAVYLPDISYSSLPRFWSKSRVKFNPMLTSSDPHNFGRGLITKLEQLELADPTSHKLVKLWHTNQDKILSQIYSLVPSATGHIKEITIFPTYFGTQTSFDILTAFPAHLHLALRQDSGLTTMVEAVLTALIRHDAYANFGAKWSETEFLVDYLLSRTPLSELVKKLDPQIPFIGTLPATRKLITRSDLHESRQFLRHIGAPVYEKPFNLQNNYPSYAGSKISHLTPRELLVLSRLVQDAPNLVSYDQLADLIFTHDQAFSLYTIAKVIERLRNKLERQGIAGSFLTTVRNQGYRLLN